MKRSKQVLYIKNRKEYPAAMKQACLDAFQAGNSFITVGRMFNLSDQTVRGWAIKAGLYAVTPRAVKPRMTLVTPRKVTAQPLRLTASSVVADIEAVTIHDENTISYRGQVFTR